MKYVLTIGAQIEFDQAVLKRETEKIRKAFSNAANSDTKAIPKTFLARQNAINRLDKTIRQINRAGIDITLKEDLLRKFKKFTDLAKASKLEIAELDSTIGTVRSALEDAVDAQRKLTKEAQATKQAQEAAAKAASKLANALRERRQRSETRSNNRRTTELQVRGIEDRIKNKVKDAQSQIELLGKLDQVGQTPNTKTGRGQIKNLLKEVEGDLAEVLRIEKEYRDTIKQAEASQLAHNKSVEALAKKQKERKTAQTNRTNAGQALDTQIRELQERINRSNLPGVDKDGLVDRIVNGSKQNRNNKTGRAQTKNLLKDTEREFKELKARAQATIDLDRDLDKADQKRQKDQEARNNKAAKARKKQSDEDKTRGAFGAGRQTGLAFRRFGAFTVAAGAIYEVGQAFTSAVAEAITFQDQMVKLSQITDLATSNLGSFKTTITDLATDTGVSSAQLAESAVTIQQAGFSIRDTQKALATLAKTQLSPSFNDINNTTEGLIAVSTQFGVTGDKFDQTFSRINAVSKAFAVESEDIITAIRKTGGAFKATGGDLDELVALFTAVRSTTRESADTIATGFRTIFGRLQRPAIIQELKNFNIELTDTAGNFVGNFEAIKRINRSLADLGSGNGNLQTARIVEQIGGVRQISKTIPLIQQVGAAQRALNIAKIGSNSLDEDAAKRQQSLQTQLNKTRESFLEFIRSIGEGNSALGITFKLANDGLQTIFDLLSKNSSLATPLVALLTGSTVKAGGGFLAGLSDSLNLRGGRKSTGGQIRFASKDFFKDANRIISRPGLTFSQRAGLLNRRSGGLGVLGGGLALSGVGLAGANILRGRGNKTGASAIEGALTGALTGGGAASLTGNPAVIAAGAAVGALVGGLKAYTEAVEQARQQLADTQFQQIFDGFNQSLELINNGKISPFGQGGKIGTTINAIQERRFTATGDFRTALEGDVRATVEKLLTFNQKLAEGSETLAQFKSAGGAQTLQFIADNTVLSLADLEKEVQDVIDAKKAEQVATQALAQAQNKLLEQANLINAFGAALKDAADAANSIGGAFDFAANTFSGGTGSGFSGRAGFNTVFSRPGQVSNVNQFGAASGQLERLLGPQFKGLAQQNVGAVSLFRELPQILSDFARSRPSGNTSDSVDEFVRQRLDNIVQSSGASAINLGPIIDGIAAALTRESAGEGGQSKLIEDILGNTNQVSKQLIEQSGFENLFSFQAEAAQQFTEQFNNFAGRLKVVTDREIELRNQLASNITDLASRSAQAEQFRDPQGRIRDDVIRAGNAQAQRAILTPFGRAGAIDNPDALLQASGQAQTRINALQKEINLANTPELFKKLSEQLAKTQEEAAALATAFKLATDTSARRSRIEQDLNKAQQARQQIGAGAQNFVFGNKQQRNQLNFGAGLVNLVAGGGIQNVGQRFDVLQNAKDLDPNRQLPGELLNFLEQFSELELPNIGKLEDVQKEIVRSQLAPVFTQMLQQQGVNPQQAAQQGNDLAQQAAGKAITTKEEKLIQELEALNKLDFDNAEKLRALELQNNVTLVTELNNSFETFIKELRTNLLEQQKAGLQSSVLGQTNNRTALVGQAQKFQDIISAGGSERNVDNLQAVELAKRLRDLNSVGALADLEGTLRTRAANTPRDTTIRFPGEAVDGAFGSRDKAVQKLDNEIQKIVASGAIKDPDFLFRARESAIANNQDLSAQNIMSDFLAEISKGISAELAARRVEQSNLGQEISALPQNLQDFVNKLAGLSGADFDNFNSNIRSLGNTELPTLLQQINALNSSISDLDKNIRKINGQLNNNPSAKPNAPFASNEAVNGFINQSNALASSMDNFPRTVELTANHKVEVVINGAQVLAQLEPGIKSLIEGATTDAIANFSRKKFPGAEALG